MPCHKPTLLQHIQSLHPVHTELGKEQVQKHRWVTVLQPLKDVANNVDIVQWKQLATGIYLGHAPQRVVQQSAAITHCRTKLDPGIMKINVQEKLKKQNSLKFTCSFMTLYKKVASVLNNIKVNC